MVRTDNYIKYAHTNRAFRKVLNMIEEGDRIAIGISGGKDSLTVLNALIRVRKISGINFELFPIHIHPVEEGGNYGDIKEYCNKLGVDLQVIETSIGESILTNEELKNPCFMCARVRRGLITFSPYSSE